MFVESGKTGRVLRCSSFESLTHDSVVVFDRERAFDERGGLLRCDDWGDGVCGDVEGLSSEMTRARENPHIRLDVVSIGVLRCVRPHCSGCVGVPRQG